MNSLPCFSEAARISLKRGRFPFTWQHSIWNRPGLHISLEGYYRIVITLPSWPSWLLIRNLLCFFQVIWHENKMVTKIGVEEAGQETMNGNTPKKDFQTVIEMKGSKGWELLLFLLLLTVVVQLFFLLLSFWKLAVNISALSCNISFIELLLMKLCFPSFFCPLLFGVCLRYSFPVLLLLLLIYFFVSVGYGYQML